MVHLFSFSKPKMMLASYPAVDAKMLCKVFPVLMGTQMRDPSASLVTTLKRKVQCRTEEFHEVLGMVIVECPF